MWSPCFLQKWAVLTTSDVPKGRTINDLGGGSGKSGKKNLPRYPSGKKTSNATCVGKKTQLNNLEEKKTQLNNLKEHGHTWLLHTI